MHEVQVQITDPLDMNSHHPSTDGQGVVIPSSHGHNVSWVRTLSEFFRNLRDPTKLEDVAEPGVWISEDVETDIVWHVVTVEENLMEFLMKTV